MVLAPLLDDMGDWLDDFMERQKEREQAMSPRARKQRKQERQRHQAQVDLLYGKTFSPCTRTPKPLPLASTGDPFLDQLLWHADLMISSYISSQAPNLAQIREGFHHFVKQFYRASMAPPASTSPLPFLEPERIPTNWRQTLTHPRLDDTLRCSEATKLYGICGIKWWLEGYDRAHKRFGIYQGPNQAMKAGTRRHSTLEELEAKVLDEFERKGYVIKRDKFAVHDRKGDLLFSQEAQLQHGFDHAGKKYFLSGKPDRFFSAGHDQPVIVAEAKTGLFRSPLIIGYAAQALLYCKLLQKFTKNKRPIYYLLTESKDPFNAKDLEPLLDNDTTSFLLRMQQYQQAGRKVRVMDHFSPINQAFADQFFVGMIEAKRHPELVQGASSRYICERYECDIARLGCDHYQKFNR